MARPAPREYEEHEVLSRAQIADRLHRIADQIAQGQLSIGYIQASLPDQAHYEVECEVEQYKGELKIEVEWH